MTGDLKHKSFLKFQNVQNHKKFVSVIYLERQLKVKKYNENGCKHINWILRGTPQNHAKILDFI